MLTVALIGADGAGKTTIGRKLAAHDALPVKYLYMGVNPEAGNHALPTTRLLRRVRRALGTAGNQAGPPDPSKAKPRPRGLVRRAARGVKSSLRLANQLAEEWYRQLVAWWYGARGYVVLFDRHFFSDYYAHDVEGGSTLPAMRRLHGFMLRRLYPKPKLTILLDAPAEVLFARKGEGTVDLLEARRQEYLRLGRELEHFEIVNADQPETQVAEDVVAVIRGFRNGRRGDA